MHSIVFVEGLRLVRLLHGLVIIVHRAIVNYIALGLNSRVDVSHFRLVLLDCSGCRRVHWAGFRGKGDGRGQGRIGDYRPIIVTVAETCVWTKDGQERMRKCQVFGQGLKYLPSVCKGVLTILYVTKWGLERRMMNRAVFSRTGVRTPLSSFFFCGALSLVADSQDTRSTCKALNNTTRAR